MHIAIDGTLSITDLKKKVDTLMSFIADSFTKLLQAMDIKVVLDDVLWSENLHQV